MHFQQPEEVEDLWHDLLDQRWHRLKQRHLSRLWMKTIEYGSVEQTLRTLDDCARRCAVPNLVLALKPVFSHLEVFTNAINNIVQTKSNPFGFIWGTISAVLAVSN
jgi:hypothetical protein